MKRSVHLEFAAGREIVQRRDLAFAGSHDVAGRGTAKAADEGPASNRARKPTTMTVVNSRFRSSLISLFLPGLLFMHLSGCMSASNSSYQRALLLSTVSASQSSDTDSHAAVHYVASHEQSKRCAKQTDAKIVDGNERELLEHFT